VRSLPWRKSSRSGSGNATCVEVAPLEIPADRDK
jgi:hypothetical protein